jgi:E3 ubiquitin-protein ligase HECTD1
MVCDDGSDTEDSFSESESGAPPSPRGGLSDPTPLISVSSDGSGSAGAITPAASAASEGGVATTAAKEEEREGEKKEGGEAKEDVAEEKGPDDKGDSEMAPVYLQRLLPVFTEIYHSSLAPALRKESLRLMRKMCRYIDSKCLQDLCEDTLPSDPTTPLFSARISEVLASVMESEDDHEAHLSALHIMQDLLSKNREAFDEQFVRLGLPNKIAALAGLLEGNDNDDGDDDDDSAETVSGDQTDDAESAKEAGRDDGTGKATPAAPDVSDGMRSPEVKAFLADASEICISTPYQWHDWCIVRSRDCLYLWNEYCVIELSNVSNGWFRFLVDSRLATMYSSGSTEGGPDSYGEWWVACGCDTTLMRAHVTRDLH